VDNGMMMMAKQRELKHLFRSLATLFVHLETSKVVIFENGTICSSYLAFFLPPQIARTDVMCSHIFRSFYHPPIKRGRRSSLSRKLHLYEWQQQQLMMTLVRDRHKFSHNNIKS
jgi:hypothetical protein